MKQTTLYQLTETSPFMMSFVIITQQDNAIVIDGGRAQDMPLLKQYINGRHISAWILTHAHDDHISGFVHEFATNSGKDFDIEKVYYNFPPYEIDNSLAIPDRHYYQQELDEILPAFNEVLPLFKDKAHITTQGESITIDEVKIDFLFSYHKQLTSNLMNDSSLVFKLHAPKKTVLFLGDLGPQGGDALYCESRNLLKSDIVQMAHHGHMCCGLEVYAAIAPKVCLWCAPDWLYNREAPEYIEGWEAGYAVRRERMYNTGITKLWMEQLGVKEHYVTKDGTNTIVLS